MTLSPAPLLRCTAFSQPIQAVIFDMDGLLIDSERLFKPVMMEAASAMGAPMTDAFYNSIIGTPWPETRSRLVELFGGEAQLAQFQAIFQPEIERRLANVTLMTGVLELLDHLDEAGMPMAVATSTGRIPAERHLRHVGIHHRFRTIVTRDDVSRGKPHPEPYLTAAARLGVDPAACVALEDSHNGIRAAHAAGMMAVMVPDMLPATDEISALCHHVVTDLHHVRGLLTVD